MVDARSEFEDINFEEKFFLDDASLRGEIENQNFSCWLKATAAWIKARRFFQPNSVHFMENDHFPLRVDYWNELERILLSSRMDFLGKWCNDRTHTNDETYLRHRSNSKLLTHLSLISVMDDKTKLWGALADGMLFKWEALERLCLLDLEVECFTEILIPSTLHHLGYSLGDFDSYSSAYALVRHRPEFLISDIAEFCTKGLWCCHPFKDFTKLKDLYALVQDREVRMSEKC